MKNNRYILLAMATLFAGALSSCMNGDDGLTNDDWTAPTISVAPFGNNALTESNVITIKELKAQTVGKTSSSTPNDTIRITQPWQIKARVTGNDIGSNIYNEVAIEDESGEAILVCIDRGGLFGFLPVGQQILLDLQGLYIGKYGNDPQIGTPYTNTNGYTFPSRMPFDTFNNHFKIIGQADATQVEPEIFDVTKLKDESYVKAHTGKLMTLKNVTMVDAGKLWAPDADKDKGNGVSRTVKIDGKAQSLMVVRSSSYAKFANDTIPSGPLDLTGVFTVYATNPSRYGYTWQILLRTADDIALAQTAPLDEPFDDDQGDFTIDDLSLGDGLSYVWKWASASYGMKASAYANSTNIPAQSRLTSPSIDLSSLTTATLSFDHAGKYFGEVKENCRIQVSTDGGKTWTDLTASAYPDGSSWDFVSATVDLTAYCGKSDVKIGFLYTSDASAAPTWEVKNVKVE